MNIDVSNLRVIVTAGGQGIGRAIAAAFLAGGAKVHICDIDADRLAACKAKWPQLGTSVADVSCVEQVDAFIDAAVAHMGGVDVLINNAGISGPGGLVETIDPEGWRQTMEVNINGQFFCSRRVVPYLKAQRSGSIINISTTAGLYGYPNRSPYCASKWAVIGFTKTLAMELGEFGVRANVICPGSINTARMDHVISLDAAATGRSEDEIRAGYYRQVSMRTFIEPEEIANMALFLCSPLAANISGQIISVDGHTETMRA